MTLAAIFWNYDRMMGGAMEIARDKYLEDLKLRMGNGMVKVVTDIRR